MIGIVLDGPQLEAVRKMKNGCILCGGTGSGKSRTALAYYWTLHGGIINPKKYVPLKVTPCDLYIITTAQKRDRHEWEEELTPFHLTTYEDCRIYNHNIIIDSWNNIQKYKNVRNAFFIFDEQRVVGYGNWAKALIKISASNRWILLSATPGDTWMDYITVFVANGFYKNKTDFCDQHVVWSRYSKFPKPDRYFNESKLRRLRDSILVDIETERHTVQHHEDIMCNYDTVGYKYIMTTRWDPWNNCPFKNIAQVCWALRKVVNSDISRSVAVCELLEDHPRVIIFYNFDYELELLKEIHYGDGISVAEWNGHVHEPIPETNKWVYLVQYTAGCEGWNCTLTDTIIFYSANYSYRVMTQAAGRIDRRNTPYTDLYYYHLRSRAPIDNVIAAALKRKKNFNMRKFLGKDFV